MFSLFLPGITLLTNMLDCELKNLLNMYICDF